MRKLASYLKFHDSFILGAHTQEGYGEVRLTIRGLRERKPRAEILARQFDVVCLSDAFILNDDCVPAYDANALKNEIERRLKAPNRLEIIGKYTDVRKVFGLYNHSKENGIVRRALKAGSSVRFSVKDGMPIDISPLLHTFIGEEVAFDNNREYRMIKRESDNSYIESTLYAEEEKMTNPDLIYAECPLVEEKYRKKDGIPEKILIVSRYRYTDDDILELANYRIGLL